MAPIHSWPAAAQLRRINCAPQLRDARLRTSSRSAISRFGHLIVARKIVEARDGRVELQVDGAGRAVALLADDDFGLAVHGGHLQPAT